MTGMNSRKNQVKTRQAECEKRLGNAELVIKKYGDVLEKVLAEGE